MNRREAMGLLAVGSAGLLARESRAAEPAPPKLPMLMKVGCQRNGQGAKHYEFWARHGVFNVDGWNPKVIDGVGWDLDDSLAKRDELGKYGISLDAYHLPLSSAGIDRVSVPNIMLGKSPERDREIEMVQQMIVVAAKTGVKVLNYNTTILGVQRTGRIVDPKRGNALYNSWNYEEAKRRELPNTIAGEVSIDEIYDRIGYCLDRLLPVAEANGVKLANHIADPPTPVGYRGITRWNSPDVFAGIQRFAQLYDSPAHGINLCLGSAAEGLKDPRNEILPIIRWLGERKQIFNIHMRNIRGGWNDFQETYPDNGDMDFAAVMRLLRDVGYDGMIMPDHMPRHEDPDSANQAFAFGYGYINALIQAVGSEPAA